MVTRRPENAGVKPTPKVASERIIKLLEEWNYIDDRDARNAVRKAIERIIDGKPVP